MLALCMVLYSLCTLLVYRNSETKQSLNMLLSGNKVSRCTAWHSYLICW